MQKHLKMFLNLKLNFQGPFTDVLDMVNKTIGLLPRLQGILLRPSLLTIYKAIIRPTLDCGDITIIKDIIHLFNKKLKIFNLVQPLPSQD